MFQRLSEMIIKAGESITHLIMWICVTALMAMMTLTAFDVCGRYFLNRPIRGALELTEFLLVISVAAGFAYTQTKNGHISVELVVSRLPLRYQKVIYGFGYVIALVLYALITWQCVKGGQTQWRNSVTSGAFEIPLWPFYFFLALGCAVFCLVFLSDILKLFRREVKS